MGMVKLMQDAENGETANTYNVTMYGTADEITAGIANKTIDIANVPCNLASVLYNKTEGGIKLLDINTLGVLYVVETGESIQSVEDLKGKTIYSTGKGTTPEFALNYILRENGIDPETDVTIEYKSEATEVAAALAETDDAIAVLPQPFVTTAMMQNDKLRIALSLTDEWDKLDNGSTSPASRSSAPMCWRKIPPPLKSSSKNTKLPSTIPRRMRKTLQSSSHSMRSYRRSPLL